ncbi:MAG: hypothetical protein J6S71_10540 [Clostridia bacterium]|nr:hypothetical protein [Clostridia bacterium]
MNYITVKEAAEKWGVSTRRVQILCSQNRIEGVTRFGNRLMIPSDAKYPINDTEPVKTESHHLPRRTPFLCMSDLYHTPGTADDSIPELENNILAQELFTAGIAYARGDADTVYNMANDLLANHSGFYSVISAGMLLALCAIWKGDLEMWRRAKIHIVSAEAKNDMDRDIISFAITAVDSMLYEVNSFPEWFKIGCFEPLHKDSLPAAKVFYAKYLYACAYGVATKQLEVEGVEGLALMAMLPFTFEPMISQAMADNSVLTEIYLRMTCATVYHILGNKEQAIRHIDKALYLALPDKLYGIIAQYGRTIYPLLEQRISAIDPQIWEQVRSLYLIYNAGWSSLGGKVRSRTILTTLTPREREVARLAAFGMQYSEISERLHISLSSVKQTIKIVSEKSGMDRKDFAAIL